MYNVLFKQGKVSELQLSKKASEDAVDALRLVKEAAEQPEKEAKDRHLKAWEGTATQHGFTFFHSRAIKSFTAGCVTSFVFPVSSCSRATSRYPRGKGQH